MLFSEAFKNKFLTHISGLNGMELKLSVFQIVLLFFCQNSPRLSVMFRRGHDIISDIVSNTHQETIFFSVHCHGHDRALGSWDAAHGNHTAFPQAVARPTPNKMPSALGLSDRRSPLRTPQSTADPRPLV